MSNQAGLEPRAWRLAGRLVLLVAGLGAAPGAQAHDGDWTPLFFLGLVVLAWPLAALLAAASAPPGRRAVWAAVVAGSYFLPYVAVHQALGPDWSPWLMFLPLAWTAAVLAWLRLRQRAAPVGADDAALLPLASRIDLVAVGLLFVMPLAFVPAIGGDVVQAIVPPALLRSHVSARPIGLVLLPLLAAWGLWHGWRWAWVLAVAVFATRLVAGLLLLPGLAVLGGGHTGLSVAPLAIPLVLAALALWAVCLVLLWRAPLRRHFFAPASGGAAA